ncbi:hypothetical protein TRFO_29389 [Tritrichomonas foetus]|uniref:Uncharacterized protein n=1 Tax=Tritrichomonas foetus TaxID=1144522 RepID=A0A1J4JVU6_9EUKA|nr:hypothetical protein TRFO_29389 [Tritrichomonas foetus]|eukprot:OHT03255.1 hypothetical protein TRFO_29389 [Tritrichomonas foetus]
MMSNSSKSPSSIPRPSWDKNTMIKYAHEYKLYPDKGVSLDFIETLSCYCYLINNLSVEQITKSYPEIPSVLNEIQKQPQICADETVSNLLSECFLSFILSDSDQPVQWAAEQLRKIDDPKKQNVSNFGCTKNQLISLIQRNPKQYVKSLNNDVLIPLALSKPDPVLLTYLVQEMEDRNIEVSNNLYFDVDLSILSPKLFIKYFFNFIDSPTMKTASQVFDGFKKRPPLHLLCIKEILFYSKTENTIESERKIINCEKKVENDTFEKKKIHFGSGNIQRALEMIGKRIISNLPLNFPLSVFYHPAISEFVNEIDRAGGNANNAEEESIREAINAIGIEPIPFLIPLLLEFPPWLILIKSIDADYHSKIMEVMNTILPDHNAGN